MTARYRRITMLGEPSDTQGLDANRRARCSFNIQAKKDPSEEFEEELAKILENGGIAAGVIFAGTASTLPELADVTDPAIITIVSTGGSAPEEIHNEIGAYPQPSAQLTARHKHYRIARALAYQAYNALKVIRNEIITTP
ncbi:hypothetical protein LCGC14_2440840 [marine sediment metagenome]|uniref:Uncharacterized protein n=1 Tax=marine sediment metagenome TaxID=412755 RepID=A0A0F9BJ27_9ZZZZ